MLVLVLFAYGATMLFPLVFLSVDVSVGFAALIISFFRGCQIVYYTISHIIHPTLKFARVYLLP